MLYQLTSGVGRVIRVKQHAKAIDDSIKTFEAELNAWEDHLSPTLRYRDGEPRSERKVLSAMLLFAYQYVQIDRSRRDSNVGRFCKLILYRTPSVEIDYSSSALSLASANAITRTVEELLAEGLLIRTHVHLYIMLPLIGVAD
jgi:hypothetical protein